VVSFDRGAPYGGGDWLLRGIAVRTLVRIHVPVEKGNEAIADHSLPAAIQGFKQKYNPEAMYFFPDGGVRTCIAVFDLESTSLIPVVSEPFFTQLHATVEMFPVMNADDLQEGLSQLG